MNRPVADEYWNASEKEITNLEGMDHDLDSHLSPSSLSSAIACLNPCQSSPQLHCILECTSHTPDDTLLVYDLGASAGLTLFKSYFFDYVQ